MITLLEREGFPVAVVCQTECGGERLLLRASDVYGDVFFAGEMVWEVSHRVR